MSYDLRRARSKKKKQLLHKSAVRLALVVCAALTLWAGWTGASQLWSMRSPARVNTTTDDECIKQGSKVQGSQAEVCPDKNR